MTTTTAKEESDHDIAAAVKAIRGEVSRDLATDKFIEMWLNKVVDRDTKVRQGWMRRHSHADAWESILKMLKMGFEEELNGFIRRTWQ